MRKKLFVNEIIKELKDNLFSINFLMSYINLILIKEKLNEL
jgi:hypothetical protein